MSDESFWTLKVSWSMMSLNTGTVLKYVGHGMEKEGTKLL